MALRRDPIPDSAIWNINQGRSILAKTGEFGVLYNSDDLRPDRSVRQFRQSVAQWIFASEEFAHKRLVHDGTCRTGGVIVAGFEVPAIDPLDIQRLEIAGGD